VVDGPPASRREKLAAEWKHGVAVAGVDKGLTVRSVNRSHPEFQRRGSKDFGNRYGDL
jgi:hypothetical protein